MSRDDVSVRTDLRAVLAALRELDPLERSVFQLCAVDGLDYPEIAEQLGIGVAEVEQSLASALLAIDRHLDDASRARNPIDSGASCGCRLRRAASSRGRAAHRRDQSRPRSVP